MRTAPTVWIEGTQQTITPVQIGVVNYRRWQCEFCDAVHDRLARWHRPTNHDWMPSCSRGSGPRCGWGVVGGRNARWSRQPAPGDQWPSRRRRSAAEALWTCASQTWTLLGPRWQWWQRSPVSVHRSSYIYYSSRQQWYVKYSLKYIEK